LHGLGCGVRVVARGTKELSVKPTGKFGKQFLGRGAIHVRMDPRTRSEQVGHHAALLDDVEHRNIEPRIAVRDAIEHGVEFQG
jgi:hypothetical protein